APRVGRISWLSAATSPDSQSIWGNGREISRRRRRCQAKGDSRERMSRNVSAQPQEVIADENADRCFLDRDLTLMKLRFACRRQGEAWRSACPDLTLPLLAMALVRRATTCASTMR